jgi:hypothetical protein
VRFNLLVCRITAPALGLALAAAVAACGSSSPSAGTSPSSAPAASAPATSPAATSSSAAPSGSAASSSSGSGSKAQITANWEAFFNGQTSAAQKISLLQNGQKFAATLNAQAGSSMAKTAGAKVNSVVVNSATSATVKYDITVSGSPVLTKQTGTAVYEGGTWKVSDANFCQLLTLESGGKTPSVCG